MLRPTIPLIISEAILDTDNDPRNGELVCVYRRRVSGDRRAQEQAYHRLVKTTPNPNATKKSNGELVGPPPPPPPLGADDVAAGGATGELVAEGAKVVDIITSCRR